MSDSAKNILIELLDNGHQSRADLARKLGLSRPAISAAVDKLIASGMVREAGTGASSGGKPPIMLELESPQFSAIGLDLGDGSTMRGIVIDGNARTLDEEKMNFVNNFVSIRDTALALVERLRSRDTGKSVCGIGVAVPGVVDISRNQILYSANFDLSDHDLAQPMAETCGLPVLLWNRARTAAMAEWRTGAAMNDRSFVYITFGYGIGSVIHHNGSMLNGDNFSAGEIRDVIVPRDDSGSTTYAPLELTIRSILEKYGAKPDPECYRHYLTPCAYMVRLFGSIVDPNTIVLGGRFPLLGANFLRELSAMVAHDLPKRHLAATLRYSQSGVNGPACGAALKILQRHVALLNLGEC
ncbi:MAG: ROK family protein [Victivallaceae bacterium]|nr:ROK family transcriptional regulator [Victivallaceae bacterium]